MAKSAVNTNRAPSLLVFHLNFSKKIRFRKETAFIQNTGEEQSMYEAVSISCD